MCNLYSVPSICVAPSPHASPSVRTFAFPQVFNCAWKAKEGGASIYVDGFAVAERLRVEHPEAFDFFSRTSLSYQCFDLGCHYVAEGPIFRLGASGQVVQVQQYLGALATALL